MIAGSPGWPLVLPDAVRQLAGNEGMGCSLSVGGQRAERLRSQ